MPTYGVNLRSTKLSGLGGKPRQDYLLEFELRTSSRVHPYRGSRQYKILANTPHSLPLVLLAGQCFRPGCCSARSFARRGVGTIPRWSL
eukprot:85146-Rhodomonas_salina.1